jgi:hypothetical protein
MTVTLRFIPTLFVAFALSACGGGGAHVSFIPPSPVAPIAPTTPAPTTTAANYIVATTTGSTQYATDGGFVSYNSQSGQASSSIGNSEASFQVRYDAGAKQYQIQLPASTFWEGLFLNPNQTPNTRDFRTGDVTYTTYVQLHEFAATGYSYSALALWSAPGSQAGLAGGVALGIPTTVVGVPTAGTANYNGTIIGRTTRTAFDGLGGSYWPGIVEGSINLSFDFGAATLAGRINPTIYDDVRRSIDPLSFTNTVFSKGSTSFSGSFDTPLAGSNGFAGRFTGPQAQELMGNFTFPYLSDGKTFQATGAFVGKQ